ncbi:MAG: trehalose-phosphatase [Halorientalis sp.]
MRSTQLESLRRSNVVSASSLSELSRALRSGFETHTGALLCLDFDGTLAPIADDPSEPTITPANERAIRYLSLHPRATVAIISGRALSDVRARVGVPNVVYAGNHGLELYDGNRVSTHPDALRSLPAMQRACELLRWQLAPISGVRIENKRLSLTVHYRQAPRAVVPVIETAVRRLMETPEPTTRAPFRLVSGKQSFELRPAVDWDKGDAVTQLEHGVPDGWTTIYIGDDTTDEDAFRALDAHDFDVFVGPAETTARYRIPEQSAVHTVLEWIVRLVDATDSVDTAPHRPLTPRSGDTRR